MSTPLVFNAPASKPSAINAPASSDLRNAASVKDPLQLVLDYCQWLDQNPLGVSLSSGQLLGKAGGALVGVTYDSTPADGAVPVWATASGTQKTLRAASYLLEETNPATVGSVRLGRNSEVRWDSTNRILFVLDGVTCYQGDTTAQWNSTWDTVLIASDTGGSSIDMDGTGTVEVTAPSGAFTVTSYGAVVTSTAGATLLATAGNLSLTATAAAAVATLGAGTGGSLATVELDASTGFVGIKTAGTVRLLVGSSSIEVSVAAVSFSQSLSSPSIVQAAKSSDAATQTLLIQAQDAYSSATTNKVGGVLNLGGGRGKVAGTDLAGDVRINLGSTVSSVSARCRFDVGTFASPTTILEILDAGSSYMNVRNPGNRHVSLLSGADLALQAGSGGAWIGVGSTADMQIWTGSGTRAFIWKHASSTTSLTLTLTGSATTLEFAKDQASTIKVAIPTSDVAAKDLTVEPGAPYASATGANRAGGDIVKQLHSPTNSGTTYARESAQWGTSSPPTWDRTVRVSSLTAPAGVVAASWPVPTGTAPAVRVMVSARRASDGVSAVYIIHVGLKNPSGTASKLGSEVIDSFTEAGSAGWSCAVRVTSPDLEVLVSNDGTVKWTVAIEPVYQVS